MLPQFKNMNELTEYLGNLEKRVKTLETENERLRTSLANVNTNDKNFFAMCDSFL